MAPFSPFLSEYVYHELAELSHAPPKPESVHLCDYPEAEAGRSRPELETAVGYMQDVIALGRQKREEERIGLRTPLARLTVVHRDRAVLDQLARFEAYLASELNVLEVAYDTDEEAYIQLVAKPNFPVLGKRLGPRMKAFAARIRNLDAEAIAELHANGSIDLDGEPFDTDEIEVLQQPRPGTDVVSNSRISVALDCELTAELIEGGRAREIVNRIQRARKDMDLHVADRIVVRCDGDEGLLSAVANHRDYIMRETLATTLDHDPWLGRGIETEIDGRPFVFTVTRAVYRA
jgi:isoleucyl-tRNA synthetase